jgi:uncharacterized protein YyaL (SSP411 family)
MNKLAQEKSPYLLQHAGNPVDWFPWGAEAFAKAQKENKPIFLSIGYSTCYWCHVMEKESFEQEDVAKSLEPFVCIKVDREEHPEIDEIYMESVVAMSGRGGWPMSVFLTPDLKPFWGGTFVPKDPFKQLCGQISEGWKKSEGEIRSGGEKLVSHLSQDQLPAGPEPASGVENLFARFLEQAASRFDKENGGFGPAPKFPASLAIRFLLRLSRLPISGNVPAYPLEMAEKSLAGMAVGGVFDQIGGGFHRYSVDDRWLVPHFEKMLTDNALLAVAYLEAYQLTGKEIYAGVARETLDYLLRDMKAPGGAFYSAEDAGPVGREGEFYVWDFAELEKLDGFKNFYRHFAVIKEGNFEHGKNVLCLGEEEDWEPSREGQVQKFRERLLALRSKRARPHRDEKILTSWNGLAIAALALGASALGEARYSQAAAEAAGWIKKNLWNGTFLQRRWVSGEAKYRGTAADYAYLIDGLIQLYQASFQEEHLLWAKELQAAFDQDFWDEKSNGYFTAAGQEENLILRKKDRIDGAMPSPNSVAYRNLLALSQYFQDAAYRSRAEKLWEFLRPWAERIPFGLAEAGNGLYYRVNGEKLVAAVGVDPAEMAAFRTFLPEALLACAPTGTNSQLPALQGKPSNQPAVFLCEKGVCRPPMPFGAAVESLAGIATS